MQNSRYQILALLLCIGTTQAGKIKLKNNWLLSFLGIDIKHQSKSGFTTFRICGSPLALAYTSQRGSIQSADPMVAFDEEDYETISFHEEKNNWLRIDTYKKGAKTPDSFWINLAQRVNINQEIFTTTTQTKAGKETEVKKKHALSCSAREKVFFLHKQIILDGEYQHPHNPSEKLEAGTVAYYLSESKKPMLIPWEEAQ